MENEIELAYLAGFFDGEGCISCSKVSAGSVGYQLLVVVSQNDGRALERFAARWGGKIGERTRGIHGDNCCVWNIGAKRALQCIRDLLPYLQAKKEEAEIALTWPIVEKTGRGNLTPPDIMAKRIAIYEKLRSIKHQRKSAILSELQPGVALMKAEPKLIERDYVKRALDMYSRGKTCEQVAEKMGVSLSIVSYWIRLAGISRPRGPIPKG